jgi:hypothetical protein
MSRCVYCRKYPELSKLEYYFVYFNMIFLPWRYSNFIKALERGQMVTFAYKYQLKIFRKN